jgi:small subunit ribosomal protein S4e
MSHLKRQSAPKSWPIERKGTTYIVQSNFNTKEGVPVLVLLRDILKLAGNRTEVKRIIHSNQILVNEKKVTDEKNTILLFDTVNIIPLKKCYRLEANERGKFHLEEIKESEAAKKISKITNKKILRGKKTQLNLRDGRNFLSDIKCNINDSVVINLKEGKIEKCLPLKEKAKVFVFAGKHIGKHGEIEKLNLEAKVAIVKINGKEISILINQLMVTE